MRTTRPPAPTGGTTRRADLDWLRVGAFGLLILYHVGMAFVTWDWHVKTRHPGPTIEPLMALLNPWRLSLLFFVSGCATRFMAQRLTAASLARARLSRLGIPLLFGVLVVVPPQSWVQVQEHGYRIGYLAFYGRYLSFYERFCDKGSCLILPTWNHLWFVAYLLVYTLILLGLCAATPRAVAWMGQRMATQLRGAGVLIWPALWLVLVRLNLGWRFEETHELVNDWYAHSVYGALFLLGFGVAQLDAFWQAALRLRYVAVAIALPTALLWSGYVFAFPGDAIPPHDLRVVMRCVYGVDQWACILALLGFAHRHLHAGGPVLAYLTQGVFPFYIVHQTIIVLTEFWLKQLDLPQPAEAAVLIAITAAGCWISFETARRIAWLRPLFGLRPMPADWRASRQGAVVTQ